MKTSLLPDLQCPRRAGDRACRGALELDRSVFEPVQDKGEIRDALLQCRECKQHYPIIVGVPVLLNDLFGWLRVRCRPILAAAAAAGGMNPKLNAWLEDRGWHLAGEPPDNYREAPRWVNIFTSSHYDLSTGGADDSSPLGRFIASQTGVFDVIAEMIRKHRPNGVRRSIDIGSNVGGMAWRAAGFSKQALGIDLTFNPILAARRIQCGAPIPQTGYRRYMDGDIYVERAIDGARANSEFAVCSATELPFRGTFDLALLLNIIDGVPRPRDFLASVIEYLEPGGLCVLTSPYSWSSDMSHADHWLGGKPGDPSAAAVARTLRETGLEILEDVDNVPWILREHQRWYRVFLNHCLVARKP